MSRLVIIRHGEASWHSEDYDQLTERGHEQARVVGQELVARGIEPDLIISGTLRRHRETAAGLLAGAGWAGTPLGQVDEDERWNELDADDIVRVHMPEHETMTAALAAHSGDGASSQFHEVFGAAMAAWLDGDGAHQESFTQFTTRVQAALDTVLGRLSPRGTAVVVTSGGVQNSIATQIIGGGAETWRRLFGMFPNTGLVRIAHGDDGLRLLSLGEISHLDRRPELLSDF